MGGKKKKEIFSNLALFSTTKLNRLPTKTTLSLLQVILIFQITVF